MLVNCGICPRTGEQSHSRVIIDVVPPKTFNTYSPISYVHTWLTCMHAYRHKCIHVYMGAHSCLPALASTVYTQTHQHEKPHIQTLVFRETREARQSKLMDKLKHQTTKVRLQFLCSRNMVWVWHTGSQESEGYSLL